MPDVIQKETLETLTPVENATAVPTVEVASQPVATEFSQEFKDQVAAGEAGRLAEVSDGISKFSEEQSKLNQKKDLPVIVDENTLSPDREYATRPIITTELTKEEWEKKQKAPPTESVLWLITSIKKALKGTTGSELRFEQKQAA